RLHRNKAAVTPGKQTRSVLANKITRGRMAGTRERFLLAERWIRGESFVYEPKTRPERAAGTTESWMTQYLISFGAHAMDHIPGEDAPAVAGAAHAAVQEAVNAGVQVSAGGLENQPASIVATDGAVTGGPDPDALGRLTLLA